MTLIRRPNPFGELMSLRQAMDRLFEDSVVRPYRGGRPDDNAPDDNVLALDVYATHDSLVVEAALPGVKPEDVEITVLGDTLTISGRTASEQSRDEDGYTYREIRRGAFTRTVTLPSGLKSDAATASFENGLLRLSFPKAEQARPRQIQIKPTTESQASTENLEPSAEQQPAELSAEQSSGESQPNNDWSSAGPAVEQSQGEEPRTEWQSTSEWQAGDQWQPDAQGNGQRVEQAS